MFLLATNPVAAADIQFVFENQRYGHRRERFLEIAIECQDALHTAPLAGRLNRHILTCANSAAVDAAGVPAKVEIRTDHVLNHETHRSGWVPRGGIDGL